MKLDRRDLLSAGLVLALSAWAGCQTADTAANQCELPATANRPAITGACCELTLAGERTSQGVCDGPICTNGAEQQLSATCGASEDAGGRDSGRGLVDRGFGGSDGGAGGEDGGGGVDGGAGGAGGADGGDGADGAGGADGGVENPCRDVVCEAGQRCDAATGLCVGRDVGVPAGACSGPDQCPQGECLTAEDSEGAVPGGFCRVDCRDDAICGADSICLPSGQSDICFQRCRAAGDCRENWACIDAPEEETGICLPDCRVVGCGRGQACDEDTGACTAAPVACRYPCQAGEECRDGRCVRLNETCITDYHCDALTRQCHDGRCVVPEFSDCAVAGDCDRTQTCVPRGQNPVDGGLCLYSCQSDDACPADHACYAELGNACYYVFCGPGQQGGDNGQIYGACQAGRQGQWQGTCLPVAVGDPQVPNDFGLCLEAGNAAEGQACDGQVEGREPAARALQCAPGGLCYGDPDDSLDPDQDWAGRGECAGMCDPRAPRCSAGRTCVNFSELDDPATPEFDETRALGICLRSDCSVRGANCGAGQHCRPYNFLADEGLCSAAGRAGIGEACEEHADCTDAAFCANAGEGPVCLFICNPQAPSCAQGQSCFSEEGWAFGVCL